MSGLERSPCVEPIEPVCNRKHLSAERCLPNFGLNAAKHDLEIGITMWPSHEKLSSTLSAFVHYNVVFPDL